MHTSMPRVFTERRGERELPHGACSPPCIYATKSRYHQNIYAFTHPLNPYEIANDIALREHAHVTMQHINHVRQCFMYGVHDNLVMTLNCSIMINSIHAFLHVFLTNPPVEGWADSASIFHRSDHSGSLNSCLSTRPKRDESASVQAHELQAYSECTERQCAAFGLATGAAFDMLNGVAARGGGVAIPRKATGASKTNYQYAQ